MKLDVIQEVQDSADIDGPRSAHCLDHHLSLESRILVNLELASPHNGIQEAVLMKCFEIPWSTSSFWLIFYRNTVAIATMIGEFPSHHWDCKRHGLFLFFF